MSKLPRLDHTDNKKLYTYTVYRLGSSIFQYVLKRHIIDVYKPVFDHNFDYRFNDFEAFHKEITDQGFVPFFPDKVDLKNNIVMTYL